MCKVTHCVQSYTLYVKLHTEYKSSFTLIVKKNSPNLKYFTLTPWLTWLTNMRYESAIPHPITIQNMRFERLNTTHCTTLLNTQASVTPNITQSYNTVTHAERVTHIGVHRRPFFP